MFEAREVRIHIDDALGRIASACDEVIVSGGVEETEFGKAVLARTEEVAHAAMREVGTGDFEAVIGAGEDLEPIGGPGVGDEDAVALLGAAADAPAQLVEL